MQASQSKQIQEIINIVPGLCMSMGIIKSIYDTQGNMKLTHMPYALYPYSLKQSTYHKIFTLHTIWQKLIAKISGDKQFLLDLADKISHEDQYMSKMAEIYKKYYQNQKPQIVCARVDYMGDDEPKLVEFNLMSVGLNGISDRVQALSSILKVHPEDITDAKYTVNKNQQVFCEAFIKCLQICGYTTGYIMMVTHSGQFNFGDQNAFKLQMLKQGRLVITATFPQLVEGMTVSEEDRAAIYKGKRIDGFYFRTGYSPNHFQQEKYWKLKEDIERSESIKIPSITMILINTKTIQAKLSQREVLTRFLSTEEIQLLDDVHGEIYDLHQVTEQTCEELIKKMETIDYVLKPNREGGGNNYFGKEALEKFKELKAANKLKSNILMKKIVCREEPNVFIANFESNYFSATVCQYSTFGALVYHKGEPVYNECGGSLIRLKKADLNEGGIAINLGAIAGLYLTLD